MNSPDKENVDMEADFVEIQQQNSHNSATINENPIPSFQNHENKGDYFA